MLLNVQHCFGIATQSFCCNQLAVCPAAAATLHKLSGVHHTSSRHCCIPFYCTARGPRGEFQAGEGGAVVRVLLNEFRDCGKFLLSLPPHSPTMKRCKQISQLAPNL